MTTTTLPDVIGPILGFLAADTDVTAARTTDTGPPVVKGSIDVRLRAGSVYPFLKVARVGGNAVDGRLDRPLLQLEAIGPPNALSTETDDQVRALLQTAWAALWHRLRWHTVGGVRFAAMTSLGHMQDGFDDAEKQIRYFSRVSLTIYGSGS